MKKPGESEARRIISFYAVLMEQMNNPLLLNLFWEMIRYIRYPSPCCPDGAPFIDPLVTAGMLQNFLVTSKEGRTDEALATARSFHKDVMTPLFQQIPRCCHKMEPTQQIAFDWKIFRDHPQLCYSLAEQMMMKIDTGFYPQGMFFPSCAALAEEYQVSLITMRRTIALLDNMCFTKTFNGVGTQVIYMTGDTGIPDFQRPGIRKNQILSLQAMHLAALTCESISNDTLSRLDPIGLDELKTQIRKALDKELPHHFLGNCLHFISEKSSSALIREVYSKLLQLMIWGCALHIFSASPEITSLYREGALRLQIKLKDNDIPGFSKVLSKFLYSRLDATREHLIQLGFRKEELV